MVTLNKGIAVNVEFIRDGQRTLSADSWTLYHDVNDAGSEFSSSVMVLECNGKFCPIVAIGYRGYGEWGLDRSNPDIYVSYKQWNYRESFANCFAKWSANPDWWATAEEALEVGQFCFDQRIW